MKRSFPLAMALLLATGCTFGMPTGTRFPGGTTPAPSPSSALNDVIAKTNQQIADNLNTPVTLSFPVRLGLLFYGYTPELKAEDQQTALDNLQATLKGSGLVKTSLLIDASLTRPGDSLDALRQLASRFGVDVLVLVSGSDSFTRADSQPLGFFDQFTDKAYYESRSTLTALAVSVLSGRFLEPLQAIGKSGPTLLNPDDTSFSSGRYELTKQSELAAVTAMQNKLLDALKAVQGQPATPAGSPTPTPSPTPSTNPSPSPSPSASASPGQ